MLLFYDATLKVVIRNLDVHAGFIISCPSGVPSDSRPKLNDMMTCLSDKKGRKGKGGGVSRGVCKVRRTITSVLALIKTVFYGIQKN